MRDTYSTTSKLPLCLFTMSTTIPTASAGGAAPTRVSRGPTAEEWDEMKEHIYRIHIKEGNTLETLKARTKSEHNFEAT